MADDRDLALSLAFMRGHPAQAARVLETLPADTAAALFDRVPARLGAAVLTAMLPQRAAACVALLDDARVLELLASMGTQPAVAMLRDVPEPRRKGLIGGLPTAVALASALLLGYADDTLGACADPDVVALPADTRAEFALTRVREASGSLAFVCVVDAERRLSAIVELTTLLKAPANATLATLSQRPHDRLPANTPLEAAAVHPAWQHASALPVVERGDEHLAFDLSDETVARTSLRRLGVGHPVNLERPVSLAARLGGHMVQGHVDGVGTVVAIDPDSNDGALLRIEVPTDLLRYAISKGSITIDGVSLTVATLHDDGVTIALIPHTLAVTTLGTAVVGDPVNLEMDMIARYVERLMERS